MKEKSAEFAEFPGRRMNGSFFDLRIVWGHIDKKKQNENRQKHDCGQCVHFRFDSLSDFTVYFCRQCIYSGSFVKWVITKSSSDIVNASRNPEKIPGMISGRTTFLNA